MVHLWWKRSSLENYKKATQSVGELMERCEENSRLKAELDCAKKVNQLICLNNIILVLKLFQLSYWQACKKKLKQSKLSMMMN